MRHPVAARAIAARIWDRTPSTAPSIQMANRMRMVFSKLNCKPRWRERLPEIEIPPRPDPCVVRRKPGRLMPVREDLDRVCSCYEVVISSNPADACPGRGLPTLGARYGEVES